MREGARVEHHAEHRAGRALAPRLVDPIDQLAFVIRLPEIEFERQPHRFIAAHLFNVGECLRAIDARFAGAKQVQVRTIQDQHFFHRSLVSGIIVR